MDNQADSNGKLTDDTEYKVKLEIFEGPMDLLIHLIRKNEVDIFDIPISIITDQYLEYLDYWLLLLMTINYLIRHQESECFQIRG